MSIVIVNFFILNAARKSDEVLEPDEWKRSRPVLRGERGRKPSDLLGSKPELKMKAPKPAMPEAKQLKMLSVIIEEINTIYGSKGDTNVRTKAAMQIRDILMSDPRLKASAKNNPFSDFKFIYKDSVSDALVAGYDENIDFYTLLLGNEELRDKITEVFMGDIYKTLREGS